MLESGVFVHRALPNRLPRSTRHREPENVTINC